MTFASSRTGPKPRFTEQDAVFAALDLGLDTFTLASVAQSLGIGTSSLYRVISSRDDLVHLCLSYVSGQFRLRQDELSWDKLLLAVVDDAWALLERYPGLDSIFISTPTASRYFDDFFAKLEARLLAGGFPGSRKRIEFAIDFIFDTTAITHSEVMAVRKDFDKLKEASASNNAPDRFFAFEDSWAERGWLDRKVKFIIAGINAGLDLE